MRLTFCGGAQSVTGANYLLEIGEIKLLIDCGLFQGSVEVQLRNYESFPYDPKTITAVFLTHSHADHTGRLPKLYKDGFRGSLYATAPTLDVARVALPDNLSILMSEARRAGRDALYTEDDVNQMMALGKPTPYGQPITVAPGITAILHDAGHILGSTIVEIKAEGKRIYFSGDLGNPPSLLLEHFEYPLEADYIVIESAYGNRVHEDRAQRKQKLQSAIRDTIRAGGVLMIPSFALERTQELLFELNSMINIGEIPRVPIFMDSPLATKITQVFQRHTAYFNEQARRMLQYDSNLFDFPGLIYTITSEQSKRINEVPAPKIIIAGSGMSNGGRILHHERRYLSDPSSTLLFIGFQAEGTLGRRILDGATSVKIFDEIVAVRCRVEAIGGYSAHADQPMILSWIKKGAEGGKLKKVFTVQGEENSAIALAAAIRERLGVAAEAPLPDQSVEL